jgi:hypothetical protein
MIPPPPPNARPTLEQAVLWPFFTGLGLMLGQLIWAVGAGAAIDWSGRITGHFIVTAIIGLPILMAVLSAFLSGGGRREMPGGRALWGAPGTLFYRTVRASLFLCGFVLFYFAISVVLFRDPVPVWGLSAIVQAVLTLIWFGALQLGPWKTRPEGPVG